MASGGLEICVSSTSFQKNDIGWPQQPPTEKVLKFNWIFHDSTPKIIFSKLVDETQISKPPDATRQHNSMKLLIILPLRANLLYILHYETPCILATALKSYIKWLL